VCREDMEEAKLQSAYDRAAFVYARNQASPFLPRELDSPSHAEVNAFTTDGANVKFFHVGADKNITWVEEVQLLTAPSPLGLGGWCFLSHVVGRPGQ
jgi:hypothetical protein